MINVAIRWLVFVMIASVARGNVVIDPKTHAQVKQIIHRIQSQRATQSVAKTIDLISHHFLATPYQAHTLSASHEQEQLVVNFQAVGCLTLLEYVEALRRSHSSNEFIDHLMKVRYIEGKISYQNRKHFLSDWSQCTPMNAVDITSLLSQHHHTVTKVLNFKRSREYYLPKRGLTRRRVTYIPTQYVDQTVLNQLNTGDYVGIYSHSKGLDVSHVGIIVKNAHNTYFRHASSHRVNRKVVEVDFLRYIQSTPGIVVLRPQAN